MIAVFTMDKEIDDRNSKRQSPSRSNSIRQKPFETGENAPRRQLKSDEKSEVLRRICMCGLLNGLIYLCSILCFEYVVNLGINIIFAPSSEEGSTDRKKYWVRLGAIFLFQTFWVIPLFVLCKIVNALWFQDIANSAYRYSRGRPVYSQKLSVILADAVFSMAIQLLFLVQAVAVSYIPIYLVGSFLSFIQMCMLHALYAFEYKWFNMGWETHRRLSFIEANWPYFIGFGLPMAIVTQLSESFVINGCIFSILFQFFIISGNEASPVTGCGGVPLRFFAPVICLSNCLFSRTVGSPQKITKS